MMSYQEEIFQLHEERGEEQYWVLDIILDDYIIAFRDREEEVLNYLIKWHKRVKKSSTKERDALSDSIYRLAREMKKHNITAKYLAELLPLVANRIETINNIAFYYQKGGNYKQSLKYYKLALEEIQQNKSGLDDVIQYNKIGYFYEWQKKFKKADQWYQRSLALLKDKPLKKTNNKVLLNQMLRIAQYFAEERQDVVSALDYLDHGFEISESRGMRVKFIAWREKINPEQK